MSPEEPGPQPAETGPLAEQTDARSARADWRSSILGTAGISLLIGIWLLVSPAVLSYDEPALPLIWGAVIVVLSLLRLLAPTRSQTLAITLILAGIFTALSAVLADEEAPETANAALMGGAVIVLAAIGLAAEEEAAIESRP